MRVNNTSPDFQTEYATRVFKVAKNAMKAQGEQTLQLIESAKTDAPKSAPARPGRGQLINVIA